MFDRQLKHYCLSVTGHACNCRPQSCPQIRNHCHTARLWNDVLSETLNHTIAITSSHHTARLSIPYPYPHHITLQCGYIRSLSSLIASHTSNNIESLTLNTHVWFTITDTKCLQACGLTEPFHILQLSWLLCMWDTLKDSKESRKALAL